MQDELDHVTQKSYTKKVTTKYLQWLKNNMKSLSKQLIICSNKNELKLQHAIKTESNYDNAVEELAIVFFISENFRTIIQNIPHCVMIEDYNDSSKNANVSTTKSTSCKNISQLNITATYQLISYVKSIENNYFILK